MVFSAKEREKNLIKMAEKELDVLVIGGGITGAGITLDAVTRGLKVGTIEMRDFGSGTSSRSTKLVHGGLRYLLQMDVKTVAEVGQERAIVYENAPQITTPVKMVLPFYSGGTFGPATTAIGLDLYDFLAKVKKDERKFMLKKSDSLRREPCLKAKGLKGTGVYVEYRTDDCRLTLETMKKAAQEGAYVANYTKATKLLYSNKTGKIIGITAFDTIEEKEYTIYAKRIVNAAGPWVDNIREMDKSKKGKYLHLTKGIHLVFDGKRFPLKNAVYFDTPFNDKRMMFAIPREEKVYVGTTDTIYSKDLREPDVTREDVVYILEGINQMFDIDPLKIEDIESSWAGVRPLVHEEGKKPSEISRRDEIFHSESGLYSIAGGKLTGYRKMAEEIVNRVLKDLNKNEGIPYQGCQTKYLTLSGGDVGGDEGFSDFIKKHVEIGIKEYQLTESDAKKLVQRYGSNVLRVYRYLEEENEHNLSKIDYAMLRFALEEEMIIHPIDFLLRRSSYMLFNMSHCQAIQKQVIKEMASYYHWTADYQKQMEKEVSEEIAQHLTFKY